VVWQGGPTISEVLAQWQLEAAPSSKPPKAGKPLEVESAVRDLLCSLSLFLNENHMSANVDLPTRAPRWRDWPFGFGSKGSFGQFSKDKAGEAGTGEQLMVELMSTVAGHSTTEERVRFARDLRLFLTISDPTVGAWEAEANLRSLDALLDAGADPNTKLEHGDHLTALSKASMVGNVKAVKSLLRNGADPRLRCGADGKGKGPFEVALQYQPDNVLLLDQLMGAESPEEAKEEKLMYRIPVYRGPLPVP